MYAELGPEFVDYDEFHAQVDLNYDWDLQNELFTINEIDRMPGWLELQKRNYETETESACPTVHRHQLNKMQKFAFDIVQTFHSNNNQLLMILNGVAGCGKTFTINAICTYLKETVKRAAPTAKAAFLIRGETLHALLHINSNTNSFKKLLDNVLAELQEIFRVVECIIIDEYSMVSQLMLGMIDYRLRQIKQNNSEYFGGISIILTGKNNYYL